MAEEEKWLDEDVAQAVDQERDDSWLAVFARLNRGEFPGSALLSAPGRVEFWVEFFRQHLALQNEAGRRARLVLVFVPRSPHFVGAFLQAVEIPASEKLRLVGWLASEKAEHRQKHPLFKETCRVVLDALLAERGGRYGWEDCGITDAPQLLQLLYKIMLLLFPPRQGSSKERRRPNRKVQHPRGRPSIVRIPLSQALARMPARNRPASKAHVRAWQVAPFLRFAAPTVQEIVFSWVADFPELLCRLGGYELPDEWQERIKAELKRLFQGSRRPEVVRALRDYQHQLRGQVAIWAQEALRGWEAATRARFAPSGGQESTG